MGLYRRIIGHGRVGFLDILDGAGAAASLYEPAEDRPSPPARTRTDGFARDWAALSGDFRRALAMINDEARRKTSSAR